MWATGMMKMMLQLINVNVVIAWIMVQMVQIASNTARTDAIPDVQNVRLTFQIICDGICVLL